MENTDTQTHPAAEDNNYTSSFEQQLENYERYQKRRAKIGNLVFSLRKSLTDIASAKDTPLVDMMENNARTLNAAFEYYLDNASKSPEGDRKIALGLRAHAQMVRAINTWERLRTSKNEGTN